MQSDDDLRLIEELKAKYERERFSAGIAGVTTPEEERIDAHRKLLEERANELGDVDSKLSRKVSPTSDTRIVAGIQLALGAILLLVALLVHSFPQADVTSITGMRSLLILAGEGDAGTIREIDRRVESHQEVLLVDSLRSFSNSATMPGEFWLIAAGLIRIAMGIGIWIGSKSSMLTAGAVTLVDALALPLLLSLTLRGAASGQDIALDWPAIVVYVAMNAATAAVLLMHAASAVDIDRIINWDL